MIAVKINNKPAGSLKTEISQSEFEAEQKKDSAEKGVVSKPSSRLLYTNGAEADTAEQGSGECQIGGSSSRRKGHT